MSVYLCTKFQVSSITLTSFRQGDNFPPTTSKRTPKKPTQIRVKFHTMEDSEKQIQTLINSRTAYAGHVTKVSNEINDLIENCEHYKKLNFVRSNTCQEYYFNENSRIIDLVSKIQSYCEKFTEKFSKSSKSKRSSLKSSLLNSKSSSKNIQLQKAKH